MRVHELVDLLTQYDPDKTVVVHDAEIGKVHAAIEIPRYLHPTDSVRSWEDAIAIEVVSAPEARRRAGADR